MSSNNNQSKEAQAKAEASFKRKEDQARDGKLAMAEYEAATRAMRDRTVKLRELRLAKEAAEAAEQAANPTPKAVKAAPKPKAAAKPKAEAKPKKAKAAVKGKKEK